MSPNIDSPVQTQMAVAVFNRALSGKVYGSNTSEGRASGRRRVFVQTDTGCVLGIELDRADNVHTVKRRLQLALNVPTEESSLTFGDLVLKNDLSAVRNDTPLLLTRNFMHRSSSTPCLSPTAKDLQQRDRSDLIEILGCSKRCARTKQLVKDAVKAIKGGVDPQPVNGGLGGAYYFRNIKGQNIAIVKPTDEEPFAPNNPKGFIGKTLGQPGLKRSVRVGETGFREVAAYLLDYDNFASVPPTILVKITHSIFHVSEGISCTINKTPDKNPPVSKIASFQQFVPHDSDASDMAGRSRAPAHPLHLRDPPPPSGLYGRPPPQAGLYGRPPPDVLPLRPHPLDPRDDPRRRLPVDPHAAILALEDRLAAQNREIQDLLIDNQRLAATHVALKQELTAAERDLHIIATDSAKARDEREAEVRAMYERAAKAEAEARGVEGMREELEHVREDLVKLRANRDELVERLRGMQKEHERAKLEVAQVPEIRAEIEAMHREIQRGRAAVEYEKNAHAGNMEQSQLMEANMVSLAREVEKLRAELANAEKRARATAAAAAAAANPVAGYNTANSEMAYGGAGYADAYAMQQGGADSSGHYGSRGADGAPQYGTSAPPQYGSRAVDSASQYGSGGVSRGGPYDMQQAHAYR